VSHQGPNLSLDKSEWVGSKLNHYYDYLGVGEGHDDERDDKLHDGRDGSVDLTVVIRRPVDQFVYDQYNSLFQGDYYDLLIPALLAVRDV
jgi:hypothetical protein